MCLIYSIQNLDSRRRMIPRPWIHFSANLGRLVASGYRPPPPFAINHNHLPSQTFPHSNLCYWHNMIKITKKQDSVVWPTYMGQHSGCVSITVLHCFCPFQKIPTRGVGRKKTLVDTVNVSFYAVMEASNFLVKRPINEFMSHCIAVVRSRFYTDCSISCNLSPPNHTRQNQTISNHTNP